MRYFVISILILATTVFYSCGRRPSSVLSEDEMMELLYDIRLVQAMYSSNENFQSDSIKDLLVAGVFEKHNVTQAIFDTSLVWYADNIEIYRTINDSVSNRLRAQSELVLQQRTQNNANFTKNSGIIPRICFLNQYSPTFRFDIDSTALKPIVSSFVLKYDVLGINNQQKVTAALYFSYKDTVVIKKMHLAADRAYTFTKPHLPDSLLKNISGYVHVDMKIGQSFNIVLYNISYSDTLAVSNVDKKHRDPKMKPKIEVAAQPVALHSKLL